jgi:hypothetical protein
VLSAAAASDARRAAVRAYVLPLLCGMVSTSSSTRAKLWASNGLDIFLQLLGTEVRMVAMLVVVNSLLLLRGLGVRCCPASQFGG